MNLRHWLPRRQLVFDLLLLLGMPVVLLGSVSCSAPTYSGPVQPISIGSSHNESDTLLYIADDQGIFTRNGLRVTIKDYSSGTAAVDGMFKGEVDLAAASEFVIVQNAFKQQTIHTIGVINKNYATFLVGRTDRGIRSFSDLKGKRVGIPTQTAAQFYFGRLLDLHALSQPQMTTVNIDITQSFDSIVNGDLDAELTWEPYVSRIKEELGDKLVIWSAQSFQAMYKNVTATDAWLTQHGDQAKRVMNSLAQAEAFVMLHPDQAKTIVKNRLQYDDGYIASVWPSNQFSLLLDQSLIAAMEDEARWMIANRLTTENQVPNFLDYIYEDGLRAIKPEGVNIIR